MRPSLAEELGLAFRPAFARDRQLWLAAAVAPLSLAVVAWLVPNARGSMLISLPLVLSLVVWQPMMEELLFRGVLQGQLDRNRWAQRQYAGFTGANYATTLLFMLAHLVHHPPLWAAATFAPSLIFGYFRDRHRQIYPSMLLHAFYNGCLLAVASTR
jgi:hypothetical protein